MVTEVKVINDSDTNRIAIIHFQAKLTTLYIEHTTLKVEHLYGTGTTQNVNTKCKTKQGIRFMQAKMYLRILYLVC